MEQLNEISLPLGLDGGGMNTSSWFVGEIILHKPFTEVSVVFFFFGGGWGVKLDSGLRPKGPKGHTLGDGPGPKM